MLTPENKSPRATTNRQEGTAREPKQHPQGAHLDSNIPIRADTATYHVSRLFEDEPEFCALVARKALEQRRAGVRVSIAALWEWARVELSISRREGDPVKLNNNLKAAFARELMRRYPELSGAFEIRRARCDDCEFASVTPD